MMRARLVFLTMLVAGCGSAASPLETGHSDSVEIGLSDETQLETALHQLDSLEAEIYSSYDTRAGLIAACVKADREVLIRKVAFKLMLGKPPASDDKAAEARYYALLQEGKPDDLMPVVYLRKYYHEAILKCVLGLPNRESEKFVDKNSMPILTDSNFESETKNGIFVVDFMNHWCVPCKKMTPDLERLALYYRGKLRVGRLDVDRNMATAEKFGVKKFPTLIVFKNGKEVERTETYYNYPDLKKLFEGTL